MSNIIGYSYDRRDYKNKKRKLKHRQLLQKLFISIAKKVLPDDYRKIHFRVSYKSFYRGNSSKMIFKYYGETGKTSFVSIKLDLRGLTRNVYYGYPNDYYKCRSKRVNPFIKDNRKKARLFVIYHELHHAKLVLENDKLGWQKKTKFRRETEADIFALSKIGG